MNTLYAKIHNKIVRQDNLAYFKYAPIVQWTEQTRPKGKMYVRFVLGALFFSSFHMEQVRPTLVIATRNPAKQKRYQNLFSEHANVELLSLQSFPGLEEVAEPFKTVEENSLFKGITYALQLNQFVLSTDEALFVDFLSESEQPGAFVRRTKEGKAMSDDEVLTFWMGRLAKAPEKPHASWIYAVTLASPTKPPVQKVYKRDFFFLKEPRGPFEKGYPLSRLGVDKKVGKTYAELSLAERKEVDRDTFQGLEEMVNNYLEI